MARPPVTPDLVTGLIERCRRVFEGAVGVDADEPKAILADLTAVRDHLVTAEQGDLGEWIRDLSGEDLGNFLADMEVTARQADQDSDIGAFISALADWQTTAEAQRNGWG